MSRKEISGEKFVIAFGVDRVTGAFAQLWKKPSYDQDGAFVIVSSNGVFIDEDQDTVIPKELQDFLTKLKLRFQYWKKTSKDRPNIDEQVVIDLSRHAGGFPDVTKEVYKIFGDDL